VIHPKIKLCTNETHFLSQIATTFGDCFYEVEISRFKISKGCIMRVTFNRCQVLSASCHLSFLNIAPCIPNVGICCNADFL
jgi:hypothetical protein